MNVLESFGPPAAVADDQSASGIQEHDRRLQWERALLDQLRDHSKGGEPGARNAGAPGGGDPDRPASPRRGAPLAASLGDPRAPSRATASPIGAGGESAPRQFTTVSTSVDGHAFARPETGKAPASAPGSAGPGRGDGRSMRSALQSSEPLHPQRYAPALQARLGAAVMESGEGAKLAVRVPGVDAERQTSLVARLRRLALRFGINVREVFVNGHSWPTEGSSDAVGMNAGRANRLDREM